MSLPGNIQQMLKGLQKVQANMKKAQEELSLKSFDGTAGGGGIRCTISGDMVLKSVQISPEVLKNPEKELLEDLIQSAVNDALRQVRDEASSQFKEMSGGLGLPSGLLG